MELGRARVEKNRQGMDDVHDTGPCEHTPEIEDDRKPTTGNFGTGKPETERRGKC